MARKRKPNLFTNGTKYINKSTKCFYRSDCAPPKVIIKYLTLPSLAWNMKINKLNVSFFFKKVRICSMNIVFHYLKQKVHFKHKIVRALTENLIYVLQSKHIATPIRKWTM